MSEENKAVSRRFHEAIGKVVENSAELDQLGLLQQLGAIPTPEQGGS